MIGSKINAQTNDIDQFQWLLGNWKGVSSDGVFSETWIKSENILIGHAYNVVGSDTLFKEHIQIQKVGNFWVYVATIDPGYPVLYTLINSDDVKWIFVNYEHDFPQRVVYSRGEDGKLQVLIESDTEGIRLKEKYTLTKLQ